MKVILLLCVLVGVSQAFDCAVPATLNTLETMLCGIADTAKQVGASALDSLKDLGVQAATSLMGSLISGLQDVAAVASATDPPSKRSINAEQLVDMANFVEGHREALGDLGNVILNVTHVTISKVSTLAKEFENNPSEELLTQIMAYLQAHHMLQDSIMAWIEKNLPAASMIAMQELLHSHKRQTSDLLSQVQAVGSQLSSSFAPLVDTMKSLVSGLGQQLLGFFADLLPSTDQLQQAFAPHMDALVQHGSNLLGTATGALQALQGAVGDIMGETMKQSAPSMSGLLSHLGGAMQSLMSGQTTTAQP